MDAGPEVCDAPVSGAICASKRFGSNEDASATARHLRQALAGRQLRPWLKSNRSPNANLIIIEAKEIDIADILAMEVIDPGTQEPGD